MGPVHWLGLYSQTLRGVLGKLGGRLVGMLGRGQIGGWLGVGTVCRRTLLHVRSR